MIISNIGQLLLYRDVYKRQGCKKDDNGNVVEVDCEYDPDSKTGMPGSNRKIKGTIHWVSCAHLSLIHILNIFFVSSYSTILPI